MEIIASEFKAKCLHLMDEVAKTGEPIIITKHGKPVAQLGPVRKKPADIFGVLEDEIVIQGDIVAPTGTPWNAMTENPDDQ